MDSWEWNKIAAAFLGVVLFVLVIRLIADKIYDVPQPAKPGYTVAIPQPAEPQTAATEPLPDFTSALPMADAGRGKELASRCQQCHDLSKGGPNKIGPNLWGVVGRARASLPEYNYSAAMSASHDAWGYEQLYAFLGTPQTVVPGTKMSFTGLPAEQDRIDLLAYLRTLNTTPAPIPDPKK